VGGVEKLVEPCINLEKGKVLKKHSFHEENSSIAAVFIETGHQW